jgi:hypothetical protein
MHWKGERPRGDRGDGPAKLPEPKKLEPEEGFPGVPGQESVAVRLSKADFGMRRWPPTFTLGRSPAFRRLKTVWRVHPKRAATSVGR